MKIAIDARPLVENRTGVANYLFYILRQWEEMAITDTVLLYAHADFTWPYKSSRWIVRVTEICTADSPVFTATLPEL